MMFKIYPLKTRAKLRSQQKFRREQEPNVYTLNRIFDDDLLLCILETPQNFIEDEYSMNLI